jgi:hypothetical protein
VPVLFRAGQTVKFRRWFNDYPPADGWTYTIYFNGATNVALGNMMVRRARSKQSPGAGGRSGSGWVNSWRD